MQDKSKHILMTSPSSKIMLTDGAYTATDMIISSDHKGMSKKDTVVTFSKNLDLPIIPIEEEEIQY